MITILENVLSPDELQQVRTLANSFEWRDGRNTTGKFAGVIKRNEEAIGEASNDARQIIYNAFRRHNIFSNVCLPLRLSAMLLSRYTAPNDTYGKHVDNAVMSGKNGNVRSDCSVTLFLSNLSEYDGGELTLPSGVGLTDQTYRLRAGSAICYPSNMLHYVTRVTRGVRLAAVFWMQSQVKRHEYREILAELTKARDLVFAKEAKSETFDHIVTAHMNLLREWTDV